MTDVSPAHQAAPTGPLGGIRVVDLTINVLGPQGTQILGDMGAEIVKIEAPGGDPMRQMGPARNPDMGGFFLSLNRNKRSVLLNLKQAPAHAALLRLVETADVFVHGMRPGAAARLGIDYAAIRDCKPDIVYASASGYRKDGAHRDRPAYDDVIQGESGLAALIGRANGEVRYVPMPMADKLVGYVLASAIGMALFHRERTGQGQEVHVPMLETMLSSNLVEHLWHGILDEPEKGLGYPRMFTPHRRPYATKDGQICVLANTDEQWRRLLGAIDRPELAEDERFKHLAERSRNIAALLEILGKALPERTTAEWHERFDAADLPNGPVRDLEDILNDPYLSDTGFFHRYSHPTEGPMMVTGAPVDFSSTPGGLRSPPPNLGQDTATVLAELAFSEAEIAEINGA